MYLRNKDQSLIANPLLVYLLDMECRIWLQAMGSKRKEDDQKLRCIFHENENLADFEKTDKPKATVGVLDLTPTFSSLDNATNREEV